MTFSHIILMFLASMHTPFFFENTIHLSSLDILQKKSCLDVDILKVFLLFFKSDMVSGGHTVKPRL